MIARLWRLAAVGLGIALIGIAGCGGDPAKNAPPVLDLSAKPCTAAVELTSAQQLVVDGDSKLTMTLDSTTQCLVNPDGSRSLYALFVLPTTTTYMVSVTSLPLGRQLMSPRLALLDAQGELLREIPRTSFVFHGTALYAGVRIHSGDRYLAILSDASTVGGSLSQIQSRTSTYSAYAAPGAAFAVSTGSESTVNFTFAHSGRVTVEAKSIPTLGDSK